MAVWPNNSSRHPCFSLWKAIYDSHSRPLTQPPQLSCHVQTNRYTPVYPFSQVPEDPSPRYNNSGSLLKEVNMSRTWWNESW